MSQEANFIDDKAVAHWLEANVPGFHDLSEIRKFSGGQSNPTYLLIAQSGHYVLRAKPPGELLKSAHQVDREYRVMKALENTEIPVPKMLALNISENIDENPLGRTFFVMEYLDGHVFWDPALPELAGEAKRRRAGIYDAMNEVLAKLHEIDLAKTGLENFGKPGNYYERQLGRWVGQYSASETDRNEDIHELADWLAKNLPDDDGETSLVHGDFRLDNMVFSHDGANILGLLDWELSTLGHPLADLAYQCMQWRLPHEGGFRGLGGIDKEALGIPLEEEYVAAYCRRRNIGEIENWNFYLAFCFFRMAAILQGVYKRSLDGNASNPAKAREYGKAVPVIGRIAKDIIAR